MRVSIARVLLGATLCSPLPALAEPPAWMAAALDAEGGCRFVIEQALGWADLDLASMAAPLGRPALQWSDEDVAAFLDLADKCLPAPQSGVPAAEPVLTKFRDQLHTARDMAEHYRRAHDEMHAPAAENRWTAALLERSLAEERAAAADRRRAEAAARRVADDYARREEEAAQLRDLRREQRRAIEEADGFQRADPVDLGLVPERFVGAPIVISDLRCYFAMTGDYRCARADEAFVVLSAAVEPPAMRAAIESICEQARAALASSTCHITARLVPTAIEEEIRDFTTRTVVTAESLELLPWGNR